MSYVLSLYFGLCLQTFRKQLCFPISSFQPSNPPPLSNPKVGENKPGNGCFIYLYNLYNWSGERIPKAGSVCKVHVGHVYLVHNLGDSKVFVFYRGYFKSWAIS